MKMKIDLFYLFVLITFKFGISQTGEVTNHIYEGNKKAKTEAYVEAEKSYRKAISLAPEKSEALYNLGNTHFLDEKYDEASQRFFQSQKFAKIKNQSIVRSIIWGMCICKKKNIKMQLKHIKMH